LYRLLTTLSLLLLCCAHQSAVSVKTVARNASVTVLPKQEDKHDLQSEIEHLLFEKGFKVLSAQAAKKSIEIDRALDNSSGNEFENTSIYKAESVTSLYILTYSYKARRDVPRGIVLSSFHAQLVNAKTGAIISTHKFKQNSFGSTSLEKSLSKAFENLSCEKQ
jgi:hypothetical protein